MRRRPSGAPVPPEAVRRAAALVEFIARGLVDAPEAVRVRVVDGERGPVVQLAVAPQDMGKVIGRGGRVARAVRALVAAATGRAGRVMVDIVQAAQGEAADNSTVEAGTWD